MMTDILYKDVSLNFEKRHPVTNDIGFIINEVSIRNSIKNLLSTKPETIPFNRLKGCDLEQFLFEPNNPVTNLRIRSTIEKSLDYFEPRITILKIEIDNNHNELIINIMYKINDTNKNDNVEVILNKSR